MARGGAHIADHKTDMKSEHTKGERFNDKGQRTANAAPHNVATPSRGRRDRDAARGPASQLEDLVRRRGVEEAWNALEDMQRQGIMIDKFTVSRMLMKTMGDSRCRLNPASVYRGIGLVEKFIEMQPKDVDEVLFNALLDTCCRLKDLTRLEATVQRMRDLKVKPSPVTLGILVKTYGQAGDLQKVLQVWSEMETQRDQANAVTYGCMIDACVNCGNLEKAVEIFDGMSAAAMAEAKAAYHEQRDHLSGCIAAIGEAVAAITEGAGSAFLQTQPVAALKNLVENDEKLTDVDRKDLMAILCGTGPTDAIVGMLKQKSDVLTKRKASVKAKYGVQVRWSTKRAAADVQQLVHSANKNTCVRGIVNAGFGGIVNGGVAQTGSYGGGVVNAGFGGGIGPVHRSSDDVAPAGGVVNAGYGGGNGAGAAGGAIPAIIEQVQEVVVEVPEIQTGRWVEDLLLARTPKWCSRTRRVPEEEDEVEIRINATDDEDAEESSELLDEDEEAAATATNQTAEGLNLEELFARWATGDQFAAAPVQCAAAPAYMEPQVQHAAAPMTYAAAGDSELNGSKFAETSAEMERTRDEALREARSKEDDLTRLRSELDALRASSAQEVANLDSRASTAEQLVKRLQAVARRKPTWQQILLPELYPWWESS